MAQIRTMGVTEFKSDEETTKARELYELMKTNDQTEVPQRKKRKKKSVELPDTELAKEK